MDGDSLQATLNPVIVAFFWQTCFDNIGSCMIDDDIKINSAISEVEAVNSQSCSPFQLLGFAVSFDGPCSSVCNFYMK